MSRYFQELVRVVKVLRSVEGCPWDRKQTHISLKPLLIEETYELIDAIEEDDKTKITEELGDILIHIIFHADIGRMEKTFNIDNILQSAISKLKRRHPHIFSTNKKKLTLSAVHKQWDKIKLEENIDTLSLIKNIPRQLPSLLKASSIYSRAKKLNLIKKQSIPKTIIFELKINDENSKSEISKKLFELVSCLEEIGLNTEDLLREYNDSRIEHLISNTNDTN